MTAKTNHRKSVHTALFIFILFVKLLILIFWYNQYTVEKQLAETTENPYKQNKAFVYSNAATRQYFDAESSFIEYLHTYNPAALDNYQHSLNKMTVYLDSLNQLIAVDKHFEVSVAHKKQTEKEIIGLRRQLDGLIKNDIRALTQEPKGEFTMDRYNFRKVLSSIKYDSIRISDAVIKRGLLKRIGNAISGNYPVQREELRIHLKMTYGNSKKSGTVEEQMTNIFNSTEQHYTNEFAELRNTYSHLREKDRALMAINKKILDNSQEIILFYTQSAQESSRIALADALANIRNRKAVMISLFIALLASTGLLLYYTFVSYKNEEILAKSKADAENNLEFKNRLIGMLSHEMRAPLHIISNLAENLKLRNTNPELNHKISLLRFTSDSLQITVNQILDFFKNEHSKLVLYNSKVNLQQEIVSVVESLKTLAEGKKIELIAHLEPTLANEVWADNGKIHQLFYNIIGNAIKFTNKGSITVSAVLKENEAAFRLDVKIRDTGVGIPKEDLDKVFDKYYQSKFYKDQISFGAGLGLNLCKEIVELYDGAISISSELGHGTEIAFYLILEKANAEHVTSQSQLLANFKNRKIKLAVVDDDPVTLAVVKKLASEINFEIAGFDSAEAMETYLQTEAVDVIVTDLQIGAASGITLVETVKKMNNSNAKVPVLAITGDNYMDSVDLSTMHINEILIKPVNREEFYAKLLKVLG